MNRKPTIVCVGNDVAPELLFTKLAEEQAGNVNFQLFLAKAGKTTVDRTVMRDAIRRADAVLVGASSEPGADLENTACAFAHNARVPYGPVVDNNGGLAKKWHHPHWEYASFASVVSKRDEVLFGSKPEWLGKRVFFGGQPVWADYFKPVDRAAARAKIDAGPDVIVASVIGSKTTHINIGLASSTVAGADLVGDIIRSVLGLHPRDVTPVAEYLDIGEKLMVFGKQMPEARLQHGGGDIAGAADVVIGWGGGSVAMEAIARRLPYVVITSDDICDFCNDETGNPRSMFLHAGVAHDGGATAKSLSRVLRDIIAEPRSLAPNQELFMPEQKPGEASARILQGVFAVLSDDRG